MLSRLNLSRFIRLLLVLFVGILLILGMRLTVNALSRAGFLGAETDINFDLWHLAGICRGSKLVNTPGFGLPSEFDESNLPIKPITETPYQSEEGFEVLVFEDQLYLGMEADNLLGARLWRTRKGIRDPQSQQDWEEVAANAAGLPFGVADTAQADHIDSLGEFQGWIYASLANRSGSPQGTLVFRSPTGDPGTWEDALAVVGSGFGKAQNENFKDMQVFDGQLCGGTWNETDGAEVWCTTDGLDWQQKNRSGFGEPQNSVIWSGHVFEGQLYFGVQSASADGSQPQGRLYRTKSLAGTPVWEEVFRTAEGMSWGNILGDLEGYLYISLPSPEGMVVYRSTSGGSNTWEVASQPGFGAGPANWAVLADGAATNRGGLYVGVVNGQQNFTLWRTDGILTGKGSLVSWQQIPIPEMTDPNNIYVQLVFFNDVLYAWTSNPVSGQQVWLICE